MTLLIGVSKGMACLIPSPITISLGVQLLPITRKLAFLMFYANRRVVVIEFGI